MKKKDLADYEAPVFCCSDSDSIVQETVIRLSGTLDILERRLYEYKEDTIDSQKLRDMCFYLRKVEDGSITLLDIFEEKLEVFPQMLRMFALIAPKLDEKNRSKLRDFCQYLEVRFMIWKNQRSPFL